MEKIDLLPIINIGKQYKLIDFHISGNDSAIC